jgi:signal transduction histidine kinase
MNTIRAWSDDPTSYEPGQLYAEQITLENDQVVSIHLAPVSMRNEFLGTVSVFRDITHLIELDRLKSEFVATVSHELRTPMTSIKGYVDVLLMGAAGGMNEQQTQFLQVVKSNTDRLNVLVNDLLDVARIETGRVTLALQPLDIHQMTDSIVQDILKESQEENRPIEIQFHMPSDLPLVYGDPDRVEQILQNLIHNAYYYTPPHGHIVVRANKKGSGVQVDIEDDGIGIPLEDQTRIFERFYRGEDPLVLSTAGTGLGLSIVKDLIELHQGRIWFESTGVPGEGSTFSFTLPVFSPEIAEANG